MNAIQKPQTIPITQLFYWSAFPLFRSSNVFFSMQWAPPLLVLNGGLFVQRCNIRSRQKLSWIVWALCCQSRMRWLNSNFWCREQDIFPPELSIHLIKWLFYLLLLQSHLFMIIHLFTEPPDRMCPFLHPRHDDLGFHKLVYLIEQRSFFDKIFNPWNKNCPYF